MPVGVAEVSSKAVAEMGMNLWEMMFPEGGSKSLPCCCLGERVVLLIAGEEPEASFLLKYADGARQSRSSSSSHGGLVLIVFTA